MALITDSQWGIGAVLGIVTALCGVAGAVTALIAVGRKKAGEHEDSGCKRMRRVFEFDFYGKIVVNRDMVILDANRQARAITGYGVDLLGRSIYEIIPKMHHEQHRKHVQRYMNDPHPRKMGKQEMRLFLVDRQGVEKEMLLSLSPAENEYGEIEVAVGMQVVQD